MNYPMNLKVLLIGQGFEGGGAERRFFILAMRLFGGSADVATMHTSQVDESKLEGRYTALGWTGRMSYLTVFRRLRNLIRNGEYDVMMSFGLFPNVLTLLACRGNLGHRKVVINEITRPMEEAKTAGAIRGYIYNRLRRHTYPMADLITANSIDGLREACELAKTSVFQGVRVVNAVDAEYVAKQSALVPELVLNDDNYVVYVGRLDPMKRVDTIIEAFDIFYSDGDCKLLIVGDGPACNDLKEKAGALRCADNVVFAGNLCNPFPIINNAKAFLFASEYEGFSNSVLEAMFCNVPVITSYCSSDAVEMCERGAALGYAVGDSRALAKNLGDLLNDKLLVEKIVRNAKAYRATHSINQALACYEGLLVRVAAEGR